MAAEVGKPGTNWTQVSPAARKRINPIVQHYAKMAHPFTACVRDNTKRFGKERAERVCAVVKDMGRGTTKWRKGGGHKVTEAEVYAAANLLAEQASESLRRTEAVIGRRGIEALIVEALKATGDDGTISEAEEHALGEHLLADLVVLETMARPRDDEMEFRQLLTTPTVVEQVTAFERSLARAQKRSTREKQALDPDFEKKHRRAAAGATGGGRFVEMGEVGSTVRTVQRKVGATVDGQYGKQTQNRVRRFQRRNGLTVDGIVGRQTATAILGHAKRAKGMTIGALSRTQVRALRTRSR